MIAYSLRKRLWLMLGIIAAVIVGCSNASPSPATPTSTTSKPVANSALPTFADWRLAYMDRDGRIHAVTVNGKTDSIGPLLPLAPPGQPPSPGSGIYSAGFAPDGHTLAFVDPSLVLVDAATGHQIYVPESPSSTGAGAVWSPDGKTFALQGLSALELVQASDGTITPIPGSPPQAIYLGGWIDASHIAVDGYLSGQNTNTFVLYSLNVTTGAYRVVAQIAIPTKEIGELIFDPDGTKAMFFTSPFQDNPYTPYVAEIDIASGTVTPLPVIAKLQSPSEWISNVAWRPGTQTLALVAGFSVNGDLKNWLVNLQQDSVQQLPAIGYPQHWSPDGTTLILSSDGQNVSGVGNGPFTVTAEMFNGDQPTSQLVLTTQAMSFNSIGFIRNPGSS